ncbi:DMT family transporter [Rhodanobacter sp. Si-c]|uniref:DMT family transporter n=1 Tax=Rhodanobacter lycopersici TaxID=3162487 RepID=A0ABV3QFL7_9GAMM
MNTLAGNTDQYPGSPADRVPPHLYFVGSALFHYLGPSFAVLLFARVPVPGVAWLRIVSAAAVFALWRRPWRALHDMDGHERRLILALGGVLAVMNYCFYEAIAALPLGTVAAIEFVGPVMLAAAGARQPRNLAALALAVAGVYHLTAPLWRGQPMAFLWAFANAGLFMLYIVLAHRIARASPRTSPIDRLGAAMLVAGVAISPLGLADALPALLDPASLAAGIGVGLSSSVIPYVCDQLAMRRLPRATYAVFVALLPATAVLVGIVVLRQWPTRAEWTGVALVAVAVALHRPSD